MLPDTAENTVLLWVGILEFINHRHRETGTNGRRQRIAAFATQRRVQATEHIVKTKLTTSAFFLCDSLADFRQCPGDHQIADCQRFTQQCINRDKQRMLRDYTTRFGAVFQKALREFLQCVRKLVASGFFLCPGADLFDPLSLITTIKFTSVDPGCFQ